MNVIIPGEAGFVDHGRVRDGGVREPDCRSRVSESIFVQTSHVRFGASKCESIGQGLGGVSMLLRSRARTPRFQSLHFGTALRDRQKVYRSFSGFRINLSG